MNRIGYGILATAGAPNFSDPHSHRYRVGTIVRLGAAQGTCGCAWKTHDFNLSLGWSCYSLLFSSPGPPRFLPRPFFQARIALRELAPPFVSCRQSCHPWIRAWRRTPEHRQEVLFWPYTFYLSLTPFGLVYKFEVDMQRGFGLLSESRGPLVKITHSRRVQLCPRPNPSACGLMNDAKVLCQQ